MTIGAFTTTESDASSRPRQPVVDVLADGPWRLAMAIAIGWVVAVAFVAGTTRLVVGEALLAAAAMVAAATALGRARQVAGPRTALLLMSAAAGAWSFGTIVGVVAHVTGGTSSTVAQGLGFATSLSHLLLIAAFAAVPTTSSRAGRLRSMLDVTTIVASVLITVVALRLHWTDGSSSADVSVAIVHPILALIAVGVAGEALTNAASRWRLPLTLCTFGIVAFVLADLVVAVFSALGYTGAPPLAALGWLVGWLLIAIGVAAPVGELPLRKAHLEPQWTSTVVTAAMFLVLLLVELTGRTASQEPALMSLLLLGFGVAFVRSIVFQVETSALNRAIRHRTVEVADQLERYDEALEAAGAAVWEYDVVADRFSSSRTFDRLLGREPTGPQPLEAFLASVPEPMRSQVVAMVDHATVTEGPIELHTERRGPGGDRFFETRGSHRRAGDGSIAAYSGIVLDVTERRRGELVRAQQARRADALASLGRRTLSADGVDAVVWDSIELLADVLDTRTCRVFRRDPVGDRLRKVAALGDTDNSAEAIDELLVRRSTVLGATLLRRASGRESTPPVRSLDDPVVGAAIPTVCQTGVWGVIEVRSDPAVGLTDADISFVEAVSATLAGAVDLHAVQLELRHQAVHDHLTGLPNRALIVDRVGQLLKHSPASSVVVLQVGLDRFGAVNDSLGHAGGDEVLIELGRRLAKVAPVGGSAGRLSGDDFVLAFTAADERTVDAVIGLVRCELGRPVRVDGTEVVVTASIGGARSSTGDTAEALLANAATACDLANRQGGNRYRSFEAGDRAESIDRVRLAGELRRALREGEIVPWYQPIVRITDGRIVGAEALARWERPGGGVWTPDRFVPVAEEAGLIGDLGWAVLGRALDDLARWRGSAGETPTIEVNVATQQLVDGTIVDALRTELERTGVDPARLGLEILEGEISGGRSDLALRTIEQIKLMGDVKISVDDFGTGHSSLSRLHTFPVDRVKIDRAFIARIDDDADRALVRAIIDMARALSLDVVAEGVETEAQLAILADMGCAYAQGWLFAPALPVDDLLALPLDGSAWQSVDDDLFGPELAVD